MSSRALALVLASAFLHALWNALLKREADARSATVSVLAVAALSGLGLTLAGAGSRFPDPRGILWAVAAGVCEAGYFYTLARALARAPLGQVYAVTRGGAIVAVWPVSALVLGEAVSVAALAGVALVCLGLGVIGYGRVGAGERSGLVWAAVCALFIAAYHLCYKCALDVGAGSLALVSVSLAVALALNLGALGREQRRRLVHHLRTRTLALLGAGVICSLSFLIFLGALRSGGTGAVLTLRNTSVVFAVLLGWAIGERPTRRSLAGECLVTLGAVVLGWPR